MLAAHGAAELQHQVADLLGDRGHELDFFLLFEIDQRPNVHTADADMAVVAGTGAMIVDDFFKAAEKFWELQGVDGGILDEGDRFALAFDPHQQAEPGFAYPPDAALLWRRIGAHIGISHAFGLQACDHLLRFGLGFGRGIAAKLGDQ